MPRISDGIEPCEKKVPWAILSLCELVEASLYYGNAEGIPPATVREFDRAYRALRSVLEFYFGKGEVSLCYTPPDHRFKEKRTNQ